MSTKDQLDIPRAAKVALLTQACEAVRQEWKAAEGKPRLVHLIRAISALAGVHKDE